MIGTNGRIPRYTGEWRVLRPGLDNLNQYVHDPTHPINTSQTFIQKSVIIPSHVRYNPYADTQALDSHIDNMQPVLNQMNEEFNKATLKAKPFVYADHSHILEQRCMPDYATLTARPFSQEERLAWMTEQLGSHPDEVPGNAEFTNIVEKLSENANPINLDCFSDFVENPENTVYLEEKFLYGLNFYDNIEMHRFYDTYCGLVSELVGKLSIQELNFLQTFIYYNELLASMTLQPTFLCVFGHLYYIPLFFPLHFDGNFNILMQHAIAKQLEIKLEYEAMLSSLNELCAKHSGTFKSLDSRYFNFKYIIAKMPNLIKYNLTGSIVIGGCMFLYKKFCQIFRR